MAKWNKERIEDIISSDAGSWDCGGQTMWDYFSLEDCNAIVEEAKKEGRRELIRELNNSDCITTIEIKPRIFDEQSEFETYVKLEKWQELIKELE